MSQWHCYACRQHRELESSRSVSCGVCSSCVIETLLETEVNEPSARSRPRGSQCHGRVMVIWEYDNRGLGNVEYEVPLLVLRPDCHTSMSMFPAYQPLPKVLAGAQECGSFQWNHSLRGLVGFLFVEFHRIFWQHDPHRLPGVQQSALRIRNGIQHRKDLYNTTPHPTTPAPWMGGWMLWCGNDSHTQGSSPPEHFSLGLSHATKAYDPFLLWTCCRITFSTWISIDFFSFVSCSLFS